MKKNNITLIVIALILLIAVITNPNQEQHKEEVSAQLNSFIQKSMSKEISQSDNEWGKAGQAMGMVLGGLMIDGIISNLVTSDNYVIFSTTKISWEGETKVIGVGAFGNVFLSEKLENAFNDGLLTK